MALFRKLFYRKPPDGLLEISDRVYVFDCCFTTDAWEPEEYKGYVGSVMGQIKDYYPDASILVFNFRDERAPSQIASALTDYDLTIMDYPRQYEGCPILPMEVVHHFLRSGESWLSLGHQNVLLMHCERGGWPVLAFMLAALLIYSKQYSGEQKTLDMIYKQAPRELLQFLSPLNPIPSQLRYLQYVSRRNVATEWPPLDRGLTLDCIIMRMIPNFDGEGGCRPIFRIYGQDPQVTTDDRNPKVLFSTPKRSKAVRHYKQAECELVKIDINCNIQGDVVLECINLHDDMEREAMILRVMFNTAFIRSNILMLSRNDIDMVWDSKDQFPKDFRAEVLFSEMDAASSTVPSDLSCFEEKEGLPVEAFAKVQEMFNSVDWLVPKTDAAYDKFHQISPSKDAQEKLYQLSPSKDAQEKLLQLSPSKDIQDKLLQLSPSKDVQDKLLQLSPSKDVQEKLHSDSGKKNSHVTPEGHQDEQSRKSLESDGKSSLPSALEKQSVNQIADAGEDKAETKSSLVNQAAVETSSAGLNSKDSVSSCPPPSEDLETAPSVLPTPSTQKKSSGSRSPPAPPPPPTFPAEEKSVSGSRSPPPPPPPPTLPVKAPDISVGHSTSSLPYPVPHEPQTPPLKDSKQLRRRSPPPPPPLPNMDNANDRVVQAHPPPSQTQTSPPVPSPTPTSPPQQTQTPTPIPSENVKDTRTGPTAAVPPCPPPPPKTSDSGEDQNETFRASPSPPPPPTPPLKESLPSSGRPPPPPPPVPSSPPNDPHSFVQKSSDAPSPHPPPPPPAPNEAPPPPPPSAPNAPPPPSAPNAPPPPPPSAPNAPPPPPAPNAPPPPPTAPNAPPPPPAPNAPPPPPTAPNAPPPPPSRGSAGQAAAPSPPPLLPQSMAKGRGPPRALSSRNNQTKKLKPLHWLKLTRAVQGSLWAETQKSGEAAKAPEIDISELESLFSAAAPNSSQGGKTNSRAPVVNKPEIVQLVDHRRAYNCEIMLSKVKVPINELMNSVLDLEESALDADQLDNLIKFCPTKDEMELLKNYKGERDKLGKCEQFFLELMKVPRTESKLRVFSFKMQFRTQVSDLRNSLDVVNSTSEQIRNSAKLKKVMQTILSLGNALNQGTARGSAVGFRLDSLLKLTETRARNNKMTLMHYLCKVLADKLPELLDFSKDLCSLEPASKIQLKFLAEEMQAINKGLEKVVQELSLSENDGAVSDYFRKALKEFLCFAEGEVRSLASLYSVVGRNVDALILYFGEDPSRIQFEQVVSTLLNFVRMFNKSHEENCKQQEADKKKAEKEAANEQMKMNAHSPVKSVK